MKNKIKITAVVVAVIIGMVIYKDRFEKKEKAKKEEERRQARLDNAKRYN